jgi:hypothetical protein
MQHATEATPCPTARAAWAHRMKPGPQAACGACCQQGNASTLYTYWWQIAYIFCECSAGSACSQQQGCCCCCCGCSYATAQKATTPPSQLSDCILVQLPSCCCVSAPAASTHSDRPVMLYTVWARARLDRPLLLSQPTWPAQQPIVAGSIGISLQLLPSMQMHSSTLLRDSSRRLSSSFSHVPRSCPGHAAAGSAAFEAHGISQ